MYSAGDTAKSAEARADGNAAFKKGKWVESIGHYTTATVHNSSDPVAYCNRAQAYLKLDKYRDAERDCTTALGLQSGNIKALYRRSLARKGLGKLDEALEDLDALLRLEPHNTIAQAERDELLDARSKEARRKARLKRPISPLPAVSSAPPSQPTARIGASVSDAGEDLAAGPAAPPIASGSIPPSLAAEHPQTSPSPSSFADLRRSRGAKKSTFVPPPAPASPASPITAQVSYNSASNGTDPSSVSTADNMIIVPPAISIPPTQSATPISDAIPPYHSIPGIAFPPHPRFVPSTMPALPYLDPGAGLHLVRRLSNLEPSEAWLVISAYRPSDIPQLLRNFLDPDLLGQLLLALHHGAYLGEAERDKVRDIMEGLRRTPRLGMNAAMLSGKERAAGQDAWASSGGIGIWP